MPLTFASPFIREPQIIIEGTSLNQGIAQGYAYIYDPQYVDNPCQSVEKKIRIFLDAIDKSLLFCESSSSNQSSENQDLILVQKSLLQDLAWQQRVIKKIENGLSIGQALDATLDDFESIFKKDAFWHARFQEIRGISQLVRQYLEEKSLSFDVNKPIILCAKTISPVEMMLFESIKLVAVVVQDDSSLSHGMIIARSRGIPVINGIRELKKLILNDDELLIDGDLGRIYVRPHRTTIANYDITTKASSFESLEPAQNKTLFSRDGTPVHLLINVNMMEDLAFLNHPSIEGVGLYRTEFPFMAHENWPDVEQQTNFYLNILNKAKEKTVIFRTFDVGGDKTFQSLHKSFRNTKKDWKHTRFTLQRPSLVRLQLRAMIRARVSCDYPNLPLHIMFPMISETQELSFLKVLLQKELNREKKLGNKVPQTLSVGAMIEVPSLVFQLNQFLDLVDFISIGSNDLFHFFYAIDRTDAVMSKRYDLLSKAFIQMLKTIMEKANAKNINVSLCGEMASLPLEAMALLGIGLRYFSINPSAIQTIENMVQSLDIWSIQECMTDCLSDNPFAYKAAHLSIRERVMELAQIQQTQLS